MKEYVQSFHSHQDLGDEASREKVLDKLFADVDRYRGIPGFYWYVILFSLCLHQMGIKLTARILSRGVWSLIQAQISQIDFDYASYAELRLGEYWAWREELDGSREKEGRELPLREQRWAQEA